ncbi:MAG: iron-containing alcohol dehydrogenase [Butyrivibrio sp.]|nr:iron-containing alcohol dehydrogenase [Butyrivibrio sp.]
MDNFTYHAPTEVVFGKGAENDTGKMAAKYGASKVMLVYGGGSVIKSGLLDKVKASLNEAGVKYIEFGGAKPNPTLEHAEEGIDLAVHEQVDMIIGVGGGSSIDTAKAIAHGTANVDYPLWDIWTGKTALLRSMPVGAVLTIPAAGSEMSDSAVLTNEKLGKKQGINTDFNRCKFAIMNPEWCFTLPKYQLGAGITDIMMHTLERYFIPDYNCAMTDEIAEGLMRTVITNGLILMKDQNDYDAMAEIMWCSSLSHNNITGLGRPKDFSVHKLGHALSARYDITHGASLSAVWGSWAEYLYNYATDRFSQYARKVWHVQNSNDAQASREGILRTIDFFTMLGMPTSLSQLNVEITKKDLQLLALDATKDDTVKLTHIIPLGAKEVMDIYNAAM